jgi:UDP-N-acetyl-D-galactosamine dehydrogenase
MGYFVASKTIKLMIAHGIRIIGSKVLVLGFTFKENCPDTRNTKVTDIIKELKDFGIEVDVYDPYAINSLIRGLPIIVFDVKGILDREIVHGRL